MKFGKLLRILGVTLILSLVLAVIPAVPAAAYDYVVTVSPTSGKIGDSISIDGYSFPPSTDTSEKHARIIFAKDSAVVNQNIDTNVKTYKVVASPTINFDTDPDPGTFSAHFTIPTDLIDGTVDGTVSPGTYYIYVTMSYSAGPATLINSATSFTVTSGATLDPPSPSQGFSGSSVTMSGANFPANTALIFKFDSTTIAPTSGDSVTRSSGIFLTNITIPQTTPGVHTITVTAGTATASQQFTVTASPTMDPLTPSQGPVGTDVTLSGSNFPANSAITFKFDDTVVTPISGDAVTRSSGVFITHISVPEVTAGVHTVTASVGAASAVGQFTVTAPTTTTTTTPPVSTTTTTPPPTPQLSINESGHNVGENPAVVGIGGAGFTPNSPVTIKFDNQEVATTTSDASGVILVTFELPVAMHGDHTITASDGVHTGTKTFTVESTPPDTPQPVAPAMGAKVKSPIEFSWDKATDPSPPSNPVTYELQIATSEAFGSSSVVIDKTDLSDTTYILTPAEELELSGQSAPYYYRIRSMDAASNASPWTPVVEFYVPGGGTGSFPSWAIYTAMGVGAVLVFLIGYWLGRRSAFYY